MADQVKTPEASPLKNVTSQSVLVAEPDEINEGLGDLPSLKAGYGSSVSSGSAKHHRTKSSKRLSGRLRPNSDSRLTMGSISSVGSSGSCPNESDSTAGLPEKSRARTHHVRRPHHTQHIISQVAEWLHHEKAKQEARRLAKKKPHHARHAAHGGKDTTAAVVSPDASKRSSSELSDGAVALHELEQILSISSLGSDNEGPSTRAGHLSGRLRSRKSSHLMRKTLSATASDNDTKDDPTVPSAEVILDNSRACRPSGRRGSTTEEGWTQFKREIVRLTHTLKIPGWRSVSIDDGAEMDVQRLSGALTNAVYVVFPPERCTRERTGGSSHKRRPRKLLLRIYGPQVEHLIDRESELEILCRLARKKIGPTLLGTFANGRFEQFFEARTLTADDIRIPECSVQIAKRMRELHDGIELLGREREAGPFVWQNWDKWKERCEEVITWLDEEIMQGHQGPIRSSGELWKQRGLVCGVEWPVFRQAVRKYRDWLSNRCGGEAKVKEQLIFAHNDTQYGNLLRLEPGGESPLLRPENSHKQLQVIDFEYANANVPGLEFANHFTEWCYDYHMTDAFALHEGWYPTGEEQRRFIRAYVQHVPAARPSLTRDRSGSISRFMLDTRARPNSSYADEERSRERQVEGEIDRLQQETRLWRLANSAQWVAWGIVQAKVAGMDEALEARKNSTPTGRCDGRDNAKPASVGAAIEQRVAEEEEGAAGSEADDEEAFDYLAYAQERALLFWGDALQWGIVQREELPEELLKKVKVIAE